MSTWNDVTNYIKAQLKPGVMGNTDVQKILNAVLAIVNQMSAGSMDPQNDALWKSAVTYAKDVMPVLWMDQWLVSNVNDNTGNVPISPTGAVHPTWRVIGASAGGGIAPWATMVYPNVLEIVFRDGTLYYLDRTVVGSAPFASVNFATELADGKWKSLGGSGGGGTSLPTYIIEALLGADSPSGTNPFATLADIPGTIVEPHIISPGRLTITSPTTASLQGAKWRHESGIYEFSGTLTLPAKPTSPNNRFDIVVFPNGSTPIVQTGTAAEHPVVPNPNPGTMLGHTIYRPNLGDDIATPENPKAPSTQIVAGQQGKYAQIWKQKVARNASYDFKISFFSWSSEYGTYGQYPMNGIVLVNLVTKAGATELDPIRTSLRVMDIGVDNGDFVLVQTAADEVALYARKKSYLGNMTFQYVEPYHDNVRADALVRGGVYGDLPTGSAPIGTKFDSYNGRDYIASTGAVRFDANRQYGFVTPLTGAITFPAEMGDPGNPTRVDTGVMVKLRHNAASEPTMTMPAGVWKRCDGGEYDPGVNNDYYMIAHKNSDGKVIGVSYTITQNQL